MEIIRIPRIMQDTSRGHLLHGRTIGFVPTMGALHDGHMSLVRMARKENDITVASIYINPKQFGPTEDLTKYPRHIEADIEKLRKEELDVLFLPDDALMYPSGFSTHVDVRGLSDKMCGSFRQGHFTGVATVVVKLFNIVMPTRAYFGQKDFQQTAIIKRMTKDLNLNVDIVICPIIREDDGLAMSSRNTYLDPEQRRASTVICRCIEEASSLIESGRKDADGIKESLLNMLKTEPLITEIDYASLYDPETLEEISELPEDVLIAIAVRMGKTRLIDNMIVRVR